jgi:hypothetical protein
MDGSIDWTLPRAKRLQNWGLCANLGRWYLAMTIITQWGVAMNGKLWRTKMASAAVALAAPQK